MGMNADEESDEGTVPMKRPNKEDLASAEDVEGRTSPKGNGGESAAVRTPSRDTASIGLVAVRKRRDEVRVCGSPRCCITSPSIC